MQESDFKAKKIKEWEKLPTVDKVYCIETEETEPGFPDVMLRNSAGGYEFYEFKVSDANGVIKFKRSQPAFYRRNKGMNVTIIAYSNAKGETVTFKASLLFDKDSPFAINDRLEVLI